MMEAGEAEGAAAAERAASGNQLASQLCSEAAHACVEASSALSGPGWYR